MSLRSHLSDHRIQSQADRIRAHIIVHHLRPARLRGDGVVVLRAGDIHAEMGLSNSMPAVCSALGGRKLAEAGGVALIERKGPRAGANVYFTFALDRTPKAQVNREEEKTAFKARPSPSAETRSTRKLDLAGSLVLVSCVKSKGPHAAPARDLYTSGWFTKARSMVEGQQAPWFILSALNGLVFPDQVIEPYELTLNAMGVADRRAWAGRVLRDLEPCLEGIPRVVFFAGERYREFLVGPLRARGIEVGTPMAGLAIGQQLSWLTETA